MAVDVGSAVGYLDLDISGFLTNLKTAQSEADSTSKSLGGKIGNSFSSVGKTITSAGTTLTKNVTLPIVGIGTAAVKVTSDFDSAMSKVSAISGATGDDFDDLRNKAIEMGAKTKFSATESAQAFTYMAMAGWDTESMLEGIDGIMALSAADGLDLATTSDIVTDALTAFGMEAKDSGHFADVLAKASSSANTNVSLLGESFKYAAPVAGALGYSAEDTAIALGLMANAGIKGSQGGTALRASLSRLIKPTDNAAAMMEKYGISLTNADGTIKPLGNVMDMLRDKLGGLSEAEQAQAAATLFGQEAMSGMLAIINTSDSDYKNLTDSVYSADGAAQQMSDTMLDNLGGKLTLLKSNLEGLAIQIGDIVMPYLLKFVNKLQELVQWFQSLDDETKESIVKFAAIAAVIGPVIIVIGKLFSAVGSIISVFSNLGTFMTTLKAGFSTLGTAIGGISAPILIIIAVIAVLVAAFVNLWKNNEEFRNNITEIWDGIKTKFESFTQGIVDRLNSLGFDFENITEVLKAVWDEFCNFLAPIFEGAFQYISDTLGTILDTILGIVDFFIAIFKGDWKGAWNAIKGIFTTLWSGLISWFRNILNTLKNVFNVVLGWFGTSWDKCWNSIKNFFVNTWNSIKTFFVNTWNSIIQGVSNLINSIISFFKNLPSKIKEFFDEAINKCVEWGKNLGQKGKEAIKTLISKVTSAASGIGKKVLSIGKDIVTGVWNGISNAAEWIKEKVSGFFSGIVDGVKDVLGIGSPSKVFAKEVGRWLPPGVAQGFEGALPSAMKQIQDELDEGIDSIEADDISINAKTTAETATETFKRIYNELAVWFDSIEIRIGKSVNKMMQSLSMLIETGRIIVNSDGTLGYIGYNGFSKKPLTSNLKFNNEENKNGGDTFIFNSPKPIDEIEAAKQLKKTKRDLAEGF